jgi:hypothetical protein
LAEIFNKDLGVHDVQFLSYSSAADFVRWLNSYPATSDSEKLKIGSLNFTLNGSNPTELTKGDFKTKKLAVRIVNDKL